MLSARYYLHNFQTLVDFVCRTHADLLTAEEAMWAHTFSRQPEPARCLYVRLLGRRGSTFRLSKLQYDEIGDVAAAADALVAAGLASRRPPDSPEALIAAFTRPELQRVCSIPGARRGTRTDLIARILEPDDDAWLRHREALLGADGWLTLRGRSFHELFMLCFFGNHRQDLSEFVRRDLGTSRYVAYPLDGVSRAFFTRCQLDAHVQLMHCERKSENLAVLRAEDILSLVAALPEVVLTVDANPTSLADAHLRRRVERERNRLARQLERLKHLPEALSIYAGTARTPSRERQVRLLSALQRPREALALCESLQTAPLDDTEAQFAESHLPALRRLCGEPAVSVRRFKPRVTRLTLMDREPRVERASMRYYTRFGTCHHVENSLVCGVLGLFIWDIIFQSLPGAFFNPFQSAPADFHEPGFRSSRASAFAGRFRELDDSRAFRQRVLDTFNAEYGQANPLVHWSRLPEPVLILALERIPARHWRALFERMLSDLRQNTSGLPDLVLFPTGGGYEFIEIKGPGDALQRNQRRWMCHFAEHDIPCRVVKVRWACVDA